MGAGQRVDATKRFERPGANGLLVFIWCGLIAATVAFGRYRLGLLLFVLIMFILLALYDAIYIATARLVGLKEVEEAAIGFGPAELWSRVRGVVIRLNLLPLGSYVRYPGADATGGPAGFALLSTPRKVAITVSAPLCCAIAGACICIANGQSDWPNKAVRWLAHNVFSTPAWQTALTNFLASIASPSGVWRAFGIITLILGVLNLLPIPAASGGAAVGYLIEPILGRKQTALLMYPINAVGALAVLVIWFLALLQLSHVVFGHMFSK